MIFLIVYVEPYLVLSPIIPVGKFLLKGKYNAAKMTLKFVKLSEYNTSLYFFFKKP